MAISWCSNKVFSLLSSLVCYLHFLGWFQLVSVLSSFLGRSQQPQADLLSICNCSKKTCSVLGSRHSRWQRLRSNVAGAESWKIKMWERKEVGGAAVPEHLGLVL